MMPTLLLRLSGPMQSWGTQSRFDVRDTGLEPSKSGVIGLICAAVGRRREESIADLASMRVGVRVDREGVMLKDYQTAMNVVRASGARNADAVVSNRYYLSDACFLVGLEGDDMELLAKMHNALASPVWSLFLGRKGYPPSEPIYLPDGLTQQSLDEALRQYIALARPRSDGEKVRLVMETSQGKGTLRTDQPISFRPRMFGPRYVETELVTLNYREED